MEHEDDIPFLEPSFVEGPSGVLEDDGGGGGIINDGDLVDVFGVDEFLDDGSGLKDSVFEVVEVEVVKLAGIFELSVLLGGDDGPRTLPTTIKKEKSVFAVHVFRDIEDLESNDEDNDGARASFLFEGVAEHVSEIGDVADEEDGDGDSKCAGGDERTTTTEA
ncbi:hypothetical protein SESBI_36353 [Sesbania bispinosa]|nr:hypothetical protein SESBI_36353 [Sesbania bispinosa]